MARKKKFEMMTNLDDEAVQKTSYVKCEGSCFGRLDMSPNYMTTDERANFQDVYKETGRTSSNKMARRATSAFGSL